MRLATTVAMTLAIATLSAGCATTAMDGAERVPMAGAGECDAEATQTLRGQQATQALGAEAMRLSGARSLRWIPPNSAVTMDFRPDRLNIEYDEAMGVTAIRCG